MLLAVVISGQQQQLLLRFQDNKDTKQEKEAEAEACLLSQAPVVLEEAVDLKRQETPLLRRNRLCRGSYDVQRRCLVTFILAIIFCLVFVVLNFDPRLVNGKDDGGDGFQTPLFFFLFFIL